LLDRESISPGLRVELFVTDVARSVEFYVAVLGFKVVRADPDGYVSLARAGAMLGLNSVRSLPNDHPVKPASLERVGLGVELVIMVENVAAEHARAVEAYDHGVSPLVKRPWGLTDFRLKDPDGYYIRVTGLSGSL
jgi:catechol 2,3-dioxygenase-like lactoylglutathione lyase family enzyme